MPSQPRANARRDPRSGRAGQGGRGATHRAGQAGNTGQPGNTGRSTRNGTRTASTGRTAAPRPGGGRPGAPAGPPPSALRERVSEVSRPLLVRLSALPRMVVPLLMAALAAVGLFAPVAAAIPALVVLLVFVGWLAYLSWPVLSSSARFIRLVMMALLVAYGAIRLTH